MLPTYAHPPQGVDLGTELMEEIHLSYTSGSTAAAAPPKQNINRAVVDGCWLYSYAPYGLPLIDHQ